MFDAPHGGIVDGNHKVALVVSSTKALYLTEKLTPGSLANGGKPRNHMWINSMAPRSDQEDLFIEFHTLSIQNSKSCKLGELSTETSCMSGKGKSLPGHYSVPLC